MAPRRRPSHPLGITTVRTGLPLALVVAAGIVLIVGPRGLAPGLLLTAMFVIVADWIIRIAMASQRDRDDEAAARKRFSRSGRWADEEDAPAGDAPPDPHRDAHRSGTATPGDEPPHTRSRRQRPPRR